MKARALCLAAILLAALFTGCAPQQAAQPGSGHTFTDALGRTVTVDDPQCVVTLMGSFADVWQLAGGELAGVTADALTEWDLNLPEEIPVVGAYNAPNLEAILALDPDLVILSAETAAHVALLDALDGAGVTTACFSVTHFEDYLDMLHTCTAITGEQERFMQYGAAVAEEIEALLADTQIEGAPSVLLLITWSGGAAVQDGDTMTGRMLRELGCDNLADRTPGLLREFSLEAVIAEDPDYLLVIPMGNDESLAARNLAEMLESHPAWQSLSAVRSGRYHLLPRELFLYKPNAAWADSYRYLIEVFADA